MTEIQCPACSALLNLDLRASDQNSGRFATPLSDAQQSARKRSTEKEASRLAEFNASLVEAIREFLAVHPWEGSRLPGDIHEDFIRWCRESPDDSGLRQFLRPTPITKNRLSKLLVSEIGASWYKGPAGRVYRLPESLQPAGADDSATVGRAELAGEGSLSLAGVASMPLADHVAAVKAQAAAEDVATIPMRDGAVIDDELRARAAAEARNREMPTKEDPMQEFSPLPDHQVLDGPAIFPVDGGEAPAAPAGSWWIYISEDQAEWDPEQHEILALATLPERLVLAGAPLLRFDQDGQPYLACSVHSADGRPPGDGFLQLGPAVEDPADVAEAEAAPLPSSAELAAVAGHEALERARTAAGPAPVFLAPEDLDSYEGADPGDWG